MRKCRELSRNETILSCAKSRGLGYAGAGLGHGGNAARKIQERWGVDCCSFSAIVRLGLQSYSANRIGPKRPAATQLGLLSFYPTQHKRALTFANKASFWAAENEPEGSPICSSIQSGCCLFALAP